MVSLKYDNRLCILLENHVNFLSYYEEKLYSTLGNFYFKFCMAYSTCKIVQTSYKGCLSTGYMQCSKYQIVMPGMISFA